MPIRTNRGRAAALRRLWGWPMRSTRHLSVALAVVTVVLSTGGIAAGAGWLGSGHEQQQPQPHANAPRSTSAAPSPSPSTPDTSSSEAPTSTTHAPSSPSSPAGTSPPTGEGRAAHDPTATDTAVAFAKAFAHHPPEMPRQEWVQRLTPHVMAETVGQLRTIDPATVDVSRVTGPLTMQHSGDAVARVAAPMDSHPLTVLVVRVDGQWQVRSWGAE